jgi:hypothetical protein
MIYLIIGFLLLLVAGGIWTKENKNPLSYAAVLVLIFIGLTLAYQDVYFDLAIRNNVKDFYNTGYGTTFYTYTSIFDNYTNTTNITTNTMSYFGANDTVALEYFARQRAEYNFMPTFYILMPTMIGIIILYLFYNYYKLGLSAITGEKK